MKKLLSVLLCVLLYTACFAQRDSTHKPTFWLRPYAEGGVAFIQNTHLEEAYQTNTMFYWGFGLRIGDPLKNNLLPFIQYTRAAHTSRTTAVGGQMNDSLLNIREITAGFVFPLRRMGTTMLRGKAGVTHALIDDAINRNSGDGNGIQLGLGWEGRLDGRSRFYLDGSYNLVKYSLAAYRDYDLARLTIGIII